MTLVLDVPAAEEAVFRELADAPAEVRAAALEKAMGVLHANGNGQHAAAPEIDPEERRRFIRSLRGKYKDVGGTVDEFLRERHEEALEDERKALAS